MEGHLYILDNPSLKPGLLKIGITTCDPHNRVRQLSAVTGVPSQFNILYLRRFENPKAIEALIHQQFGKQRYAKEFFLVPLEPVVKFLDSLDLGRLPTVREEAVEPVYSSEVDNKMNWIDAWRGFYPNAKGLKFLQEHLGFCSELTQRIFSLNDEIKLRFDSDSVMFSNGVRIFLGLTPYSSKVQLAPLTLEPSDIQDLDLRDHVRDISDKKYKMGGLIRVDIYDAKMIDVAFELAKRAFHSKRDIKTWSLLGISKA